MEEITYWHKQTADKPLFPDIIWNRPTRRDMSGKLGIVGGSKQGFAGVASTYEAADKAGAGSIKILLPNALQKSLAGTMQNVIFAPSGRQGELANASSDDLLALADWSDGIILAGDLGKNSETALVLARFAEKSAKPLVLTRDTIDLLMNDMDVLVNRDNTLFVASFAQLQKIFRSVYYPKILTFSMHLMALGEALHKFTITYPVGLTVFFDNHLLAAWAGEVTATPFSDHLAIWRGDVAARAASFWLWTPGKPLASITSSFVGQA